jgi:hypothetical protein
MSSPVLVSSDTEANPRHLCVRNAVANFLLGENPSNEPLHIRSILLVENHVRSDIYRCGTRNGVRHSAISIYADTGKSP